MDPWSAVLHCFPGQTTTTMSPKSTSTEPRHPIQVVSRRTGLTADVLRVWEKRYGAVRPRRSPTHRRLYSDADVERLLLLRRATLGGRRIGSVASLSTDELGKLVTADEAAAAAAPVRASRVEPGGPGSSHLSACLEAARALDGARLETTLAAAAVALGSWELIETVVLPLLRTLGEDWREGKTRIFQEHLASAMVRSLLGTLRVAQPPGDGAPEVVVTTPAGQIHELGALMAALVAASDGWRVTYLGPNLPAEEIAAAARQRGARAVALSIIYPVDDPRLFDELRRLHHHLPGHVAIVAGGRGAAACERVVPGLRRVDDLGALRDALEGLRHLA